MSGPILSVVVPTYNEVDKIRHTLSEIAQYLADQRLDGEIIVVDDGSQDATAKEAETVWFGDTLIRVLRQPKNRGKGFAVRSGVLEAAGEFVLFTDADLSVPLAELGRFWNAFRDGAHVVIGSRRLRGSMFRRWAPGFLRLRYESTIEVHQPLHRELLGEAYQGFVRRFLGLHVTDSNCGFKCFRREPAKHVFAAATIDRWGFDAEILLIAQRHGFRVAEVEVVWRNGPNSKVNLVTAPLSALQEVLRIKRNDLRGLYGIRPEAPTSY